MKYPFISRSTFAFSDRVKAILVPLLSVLLISGYAQPSTVIPIETQQLGVALGVDADKRVGIIYFGTKLNNPSEYQYAPAMYRQGDDYSGILNSAYTPSGSRNLVEPAIWVTHADGNTSLDLH